MQKLPISISEFPELRQKNRVYVDKTKHIYSLLTENGRTFLARPRRFGKSLLVSTLEAALQGNKELFDGLWIANSDYSFEPKGVIRFDFSQLSVESIEAFRQSLFLRIQSIANSYGITLAENLNINSALDILIETLCPIKNKGPKTENSQDVIEASANEEKASFKSVAILIDEYDHPILHTLHNTALAIDIRNILKSFSGVIKAQAKRVQFVFVTGVSAFSKSGLSSGLNNLKNLTMDEDFFDICGYTDEEVDLNFKKHIEHWANLRQIPYEEIRGQLKSWYNGYCFKAGTPTIYSPFSLSNALDIKELQNFWFESATPQVLLDELRKDTRANECKLLELDQLRGTGDLLQTFEIESLPLPALLFQMGYLTIDSYDPLSRNYQLKYPNMEVRASFLRHIVALVTHQATARINPLIGDIYRILVEEKPDELIFVLTTILSGIPYSLHIEDEKFYHSLLQTIFFAAGIEAQSERLTSIGRMDIILELPTILYIVELKMNKPPEEGLDQIGTRKYYEPFMHKNKPIRALAISFLRVKTSNTENSDFVITCALRIIK